MLGATFSSFTIFFFFFKLKKILFAERVAHVSVWKIKQIVFYAHHSIKSQCHGKFESNPSLSYLKNDHMVKKKKKKKLT